MKNMIEQKIERAEKLWFVTSRIFNVMLLVALWTWDASMDHFKVVNLLLLGSLVADVLAYSWLKRLEKIADSKEA